LSGLFGKTTDALKASLDLLQVRHNVTAANVANAETPGYKAKKVDFEESLARALDLDGMRRLDIGHAGHQPSEFGRLDRVRPDVYDNPDVNMSNDGNTVDLEREMSKLLETSIRYRMASELIKRKLGGLKYAITEGGR
jgi:flagellar basal-body rod protein FlgB